MSKCKSSKSVSSGPCSSQDSQLVSSSSSDDSLSSDIGLESSCDECPNS